MFVSFIAFVCSFNHSTIRADAETKAKLDKVQEIKRYTAQIGAIKNEMAKYDEQLEDCKKYKEFLDKLTPPEWIEETKAKQKVCVHDMPFLPNILPPSLLLTPLSYACFLDYPDFKP